MSYQPQPVTVLTATAVAPLRCLIVDYDPRAAAALAACVQQVPTLALVGTCTSAEQARACLQTRAVEVLFLAAELPLLAGLALLRSLGTSPAVVLTSTYPDYNLQDYGTYGVVDYLVKPIHATRVQQIATRLSAQRETPQPVVATSPFALLHTDSLYFRAGQQLVQLRLTDVLYVEDLGDRTRVQTVHQEFITDTPFAALADQLPEPPFLRVNPTTVVALREAAPVASNALAVGSRRIAVSAALQDEVLARAFQTNLWGA